MFFDTCAFLWLTTDPRMLSVHVLNCLQQKLYPLYLSEVTALEIAIKYRIGKLPLPSTPRQWFPVQTNYYQFQIIPITLDDIFSSGELPNTHRDPFDRLIAAQAINRNLSVVTSDSMMASLGATVIW